MGFVIVSGSLLRNSGNYAKILAKIEATVPRSVTAIDFSAALIHSEFPGDNRFMSKHAGWILIGWLCVSMAVAGPKPEAKPAESPLLSAANEIIGRRNLPVAERDRLLEKLLTEA